MAFIFVFKSLTSLLPTKHRDTHNLKERGKSILQTCTHHHRRTAARSAFSFSQQNTFISQQDTPKKAVCLPSLGSDPSFLQPPYSPLCPMVRNLTHVNRGHQQSPVPSSHTTPGGGRASTGTATGQQPFLPPGTKKRARHTPPLPQAQATKQAVLPLQSRQAAPSTGSPHPKQKQVSTPRV